MRRFLLLFAACGDSAPTPADAALACPQLADTVPTGRTTASGCAILDRDTSSCRADREALGLTGVWLDFSCRVTLELDEETITATADGQPDFKSNYYTGDCHETYDGAIQNPNTIAAQHYQIAFPRTPDTFAHSMTMSAVVGLAINGVPVFGNFAAPGDDIFEEARTFDRCGGHPQMTGVYHNHAEPLSITDDDDRFVGMLRDGYAVYGRRDPDGTLPTLDLFGGHTDERGYHYHVNEQTSPRSGETQWFLTTGMFRGTPGTTCIGCR